MYNFLNIIYMKRIDFNQHYWQNAEKVLNFFKYPTTCLSADGRLAIKPKYVVAIGNDMISAYYAAQIMKAGKKQFGDYPKLLCVGGVDRFFKHVNLLSDNTVISEGAKLRMVALRLGAFPTAVLENGKNIGSDIKDVIGYLTSKQDLTAPIIFCLPQRLSLLVERAVAYAAAKLPEGSLLNAYYYVPKENLRDICQRYNGNLIDGGSLLLAEVAALYYQCGAGYRSGRFTADYEGNIPKPVIKAGNELMDKFSLRISASPLVSPLKFLRLRFLIKKDKKKMVQALNQKIKLWLKQL